MPSNPNSCSVESRLRVDQSYRLACRSCGYAFPDDGEVLVCPNPHRPSLLTTIYPSERLLCDEKGEGVYRYSCWLPVAHRMAGSARSSTYQSNRLSSLLNLPNLWITFSGYWPERGALLQTATFKELEAYGVLSRLGEGKERILVIASAGNSAAAFARICSENALRCLVIVPASGLMLMRSVYPIGPSVKVVALTDGADYSDAIAFAEAIANRDEFLWEGGVRNVGRRDGMATALVSAVETIGTLPDYYFQSIGSGTGAIAAHEAAQRLVRDSRFGRRLPHLMLSQNAPFMPVFHSWREGRASLVNTDRGDGRLLAAKIVASVLANQMPPYAVCGGLFDVLTESRGDVLAVGNREACQAMRLFEESEGVDIDPAAGIALASLIEAADSKRVIPQDIVLLHITGGGYHKRISRGKLMTPSTNLEISLKELRTAAAVAKASTLF